jgi:hypothetical protein
MEKLLLSFRAAARLLGVGRGDTLQALIKAELLRPVTLLGRSFIPREQVEALARQGEAQPAKKTKRQSTGGSIADLDLFPRKRQGQRRG